MAAFSGTTQQSLAQLLDQQGTHKDIDGHFLRYEVDPMLTETNKLRKGIHLARTLNGRDGGRPLRELIEYIGRPGVGLGPAFQRGSIAASDLYVSFDSDLARNGATAPHQSAAADLYAATEDSADSLRTRPIDSAYPSGLDVSELCACTERLADRSSEAPRV